MTNYAQDDYLLKRFLPEQWASYRSIRLEALQTNPEVFGSNYAKEVQYEDSEWSDILENPARAFFGLYYQENLIGVTGVALSKDDDSKASFIASFIRKEHRGKGLAKLFYQARLDWARKMKCDAAIVSHREGNEASKYSNQSFGFEYTHTEKKVWPDGVEADQLIYSLTL